MENKPETNGLKTSMGITGRIVIIAVLVIAVITVFYMKSRSNTDDTPVALIDMKTDNKKEEPKVKVEVKRPVKKELPQLVDLGADKCIPCKMMKPILDELKTSYKDDFGVTFIDVWKNPDAGKDYNIRVIPTQIFFNASGKELFRHEGFFSKEDIMGKWTELGYAFDGEAKESS